MGDDGSRPKPEEARTPAGYVAMLRRLRARSGLSLREIQRRAAANNETLPSSTLATMLSRDTLPSERLIAAFLRACGEEQAAVGEWIESRRRIAGRQPEAAKWQNDEHGGCRQLPMDIEDFVGRERELRYLVAQAGKAAGTAVVLTSIAGMAGVGKTRLAIRAGHQLVRAGCFDEVQLWTDLCGFDPRRQPADPAAVLESFLLALGVPADGVPHHMEARTALYRDRLAGQRALVLLDNAFDEEQVRPLLPGSPNSLVIITSRRTLTALDGARHIELGPFSPAEATALLTRIAGPQAQADPGSVRRIAELGGYLPLAVALAGRRLATRPAWSARTLAARLSSSPDRAVTGVFALSYQALTPQARRLFRLLGTHLPEDMDVPAAAALAGMPLPETEEILEGLLDDHLLTQDSPGRYRIHDLVRLFARDLPEPDRDAALARLLTHYLSAAEQVTRVLHPTERRRLPARSVVDTVWIGTRADAVRWLTQERGNLLVLARNAVHAPSPAPDLVTMLVAVLYRPLANLGMSSTQIELNLLAAGAAARIGDRRAEAQALEDLGTVYSEAGRTEEAIERNKAALDIWRELGDRTGQAGCLTGIGIAHHQQGRYEDALTCLQEGLAASQEADYRLGEASIVNTLGLVHQAKREFEAAIVWHKQSVELYRQAGSEHGEAFAMANLGWAYQRSGRPGESLELHERALKIFVRYADRYHEAEQHWGLGQAHHALGHDRLARQYWDQSINLLLELGHLTEAEAAALHRKLVPPTPEVIRLKC
ncbi:tetratricopeptide repeat protein [Kibdelosporangium persicum]|uniref:DNA-binding transcriptional activator of the SARP family n=1 Tax=Kibdelosporangium persicum TaxID=2698649 RepID=A0ABX2FFQ7_9PSEU|nr:tetratricopeptide repeat protein [Kibdelosporangium persicum]NRN70224.1 DNA-binding transcriptional activator of the SARP family [Kibdelosporangium persicum]